MCLWRCLKVKTLLKYDWLYFIKTPRLIILLVLPIFLSALSALSARYMNVILEFAMTQEGIEGIIFPEPSVNDAYIQFYSNYLQIYMLVIIFIGVGLFTVGHTKNHYPFIFTHSISKKDYILSKLVILFGITVLSMVVGSIVFMVYTYLLFEVFHVGTFILSILLFLIIVLFTMTFMALMSYLLNSYIGAITSSVIVYILLSSMASLKYGVFEYFPHRMFEYPLLLFKENNEFLPIATTTVITLMISALCLFLSLRLFKRRTLM